VKTFLLDTIVWRFSSKQRVVGWTPSRDATKLSRATTQRSNPKYDSPSREFQHGIGSHVAPYLPW
jgi:hypothetical protein